jgi:hypothetical protein
VKHPLLDNKKSIEDRIEEQIALVHDINSKYGAQLLCKDNDEYNARYDFGRKDTKIYQSGKTGQPIKSVQCYTLDKEGKTFYTPEGLTRFSDDKLLELRK